MEHAFLTAERARRVDFSGFRPEVRNLKTKGETVDTQSQVQRLRRMRQSCADMEAVFAQTMIKAMRNTIPDGGHLFKSPGSDLYDDMAYEQLATFLTRDPGLGLGQAFFDQMVRREDLEDLASQYPDLSGTARTARPDLTGLAKVARPEGIRTQDGRTITTAEPEAPADPAGQLAAPAPVQ